jgi:glycosyltransferase involved in cell wall biosynthesis
LSANDSAQRGAGSNRAGGKPVILTFTGNYLPGYKAGGILRTIVNTVDYLGDEFEFLIVTQDRDLKECTPYPDIVVKQWQPVGGAQVYYLPPEECTIKGLADLVAGTPHDILYLNSFFDSVFTIKLLLARRLGWLPQSPLILAPRGEHVHGPLRLKYPKKITYIRLTRLLGFYHNIVWQASSEYEAADIARVMKVAPEAIHVALDLPSKNSPEAAMVESYRPGGAAGVRLLFLSRLTREKNLDYALMVLAKVSAPVVFDIYGPAEDATYWKECRELIGRLPANVTVNYHGEVRPDQVLPVMGRYDLFFFPTTGENYGHVIAEALTAGTPVLISTGTPWRNLEAEGLGWDLDLAQMDAFAAVIDKLALTSREERCQQRALVKARIMTRLLDPAVLAANRQLFRRQLAAGINQR